MKSTVYVIEFSEGELAELLDIIRQQKQTTEFYPDYWQRLEGNIQRQVNYQISNKSFRCAVCNLRNKIRAEIELS